VRNLESWRAVGRHLSARRETVSAARSPGKLRCISALDFVELSIPLDVDFLGEAATRARERELLQ
jgi:hypothetical protein